MNIKYNRVSTLQQTGDRFTLDTNTYDLTLLDKCSGSVSFRDRAEASKLIPLIESDKVHTLTVEELSRLGRNMPDVIATLHFLEEHKVNVIVLNMGLQSRPNNKPNAIWSMISAVLASMYEMEKMNILERTKTGKAVAIQRGVRMGRPAKSNENVKEFLNKPKSLAIAKYIKKNKNTIKEIAAITNTSASLVLKVKKLTTA